MNDIVPDQAVDARDRPCPEPVLMARAALDGMRPGEVLALLATDPHAELDVEVFCARTGHHLVRIDRAGDGVLRFLIEHRPDQSDSD